jgi:hypothetical protein
MFTTVRQYRCNPADADEICRKVDERFADELAAQTGFDGYEVIDCGAGSLLTITVFDDRASAERSTELAAKFIREELGHLSLERKAVFTGEVRVNRAGSRMMDLVHA